MTQYCGIIITDTELYVSVSKRIQNKIKVIDRYIHKRTESLTIDLSTIHSKNTNCPTIYSIAYTGEPQLILNKINNNTPIQTAWVLKEKLSAEQNNTFNYQFILPTINNQQWVYMVGISQTDLLALKHANKVNNMEVEVISYWPIPLIDLHKSHTKPILILIEEHDIIKGYLCEGSIIISTITWNQQNETPKEMILRLLQESPINIDDSLNIQAYLSNKIYALWKQLIEQYGAVNTSTILDVVNHFTYRWNHNVYMDASVGLSYYLARAGIQSEEVI